MKELAANSVVSRAYTPQSPWLSDQLLRNWDIKRATLNFASADVLYLLDICHLNMPAMSLEKATSTIKATSGEDTLHSPPVSSKSWCMHVRHADSFTAAQLFHTMLYTNPTINFVVYLLYRSEHLRISLS